MSKSRLLDFKDSYIDLMKLVELELEENTEGKNSLIKKINKKRGNNKNKTEKKNQIHIIAALQQQLLSTFEDCNNVPDYVTQEDLMKIFWANSGVFSALSYQPAFIQRLLGYINGQQSKEAKQKWDAFYAQIRSIEQINRVPDLFLNLDAYNTHSDLPLSIQKLIAKLQQIQNYNQQEKKHSANSAQANLSGYMNAFGSKLKILTKDFLSYSIEHHKCDVEFAVLTEKQQQLSNLIAPTKKQESELNSIRLSLDALANQIPHNRKKSNQAREKLISFLDESLKELDIAFVNQKKGQDQASIFIRELKLLMDEAATQLSKHTQELEFEGLYLEFMQHVKNIKDPQVNVSKENKIKAESLAPAILEQITKFLVTRQGLPKFITQNDLIIICSCLPKVFAELSTNLLIQGRLRNGDGSKQAKAFWSFFYEELEMRAKSADAKDEKLILRYLNNEPITMLIHKMKFELEKLSSCLQKPDDELEATAKKIKPVVLKFQNDFLAKKLSNMASSRHELNSLYKTLIVARRNFENILMNQNNAPAGARRQRFFVFKSNQPTELRQLGYLTNAIANVMTEIDLRFKPEKTLDQSKMWRRKINPDELPIVIRKQVRLHS